MATKQLRLDPELIDLILSLCKYGERPSDALRRLLGLKDSKKGSKKMYENQYDQYDQYENQIILDDDADSLEQANRDFEREKFKGEEDE